MVGQASRSTKDGLELPKILMIPQKSVRDSRFRYSMANQVQNKKIPKTMISIFS